MWARQEPAQDWSGRVLGEQFRLLRLLGRGGMGDVYLAEQIPLGRTVVVKLLRAPALRAKEDDEQRFAREARALAQLNHPNIVQLYMFGRAQDGTAYLAMEYVPGRTLADLIEAHGPMPEAQALPLLRQLCDALIEAHGRGIIHRDLKPENVMLVARAEGEPLVKVLDFGIAKLADPAQLRITRSGELVGTPLYMAPEQLRGQASDARTDIYALGLIGYELLTGHVPFEPASTADILARAVRDDLEPPSLRGANVSRPSDALIVRCLARDPTRRFASAAELRDALGSAYAQLSQPSAAVTQGLRLSVWDHSEPELPSIRRHRLRSWLLGAGALAAVLGLAYAMLSGIAGGASHDDVSAATDVRVLALQDWVQGIPFPEGTDYVSFEPELIEARVPAPPAVVLTFYRGQLASKWGGYADLPDGLVWNDPLALIETLTVTPLDAGTRLLITRRSERK